MSQKSQTQTLTNSKNQILKNSKNLILKRFKKNSNCKKKYLTQQLKFELNSTESLTKLKTHILLPTHIVTKF